MKKEITNGIATHLREQAKDRYTVEAYNNESQGYSDTIILEGPGLLLYLYIRDNVVQAASTYNKIPDTYIELQNPDSLSSIDKLVDQMIQESVRLEHPGALC